MVAERLLPGRRGAGFVVGVIDDQGRIEVDVQPVLISGGRSGVPGRRSRGGPRGPHRGQVGGVDALIDQPPHRRRRRRGTEHMLTIAAQLADPVDAVRPVGDRGGQISEDITGGVNPRAPVGVGQSYGDLR